MSSKRKSHRAKKRSDKRKASAEVVRERLEASTQTELERAPHPAPPAVPPEESVAAHAEAVVPEDERSVPPAGDLDTRFFSDPPSWPALPAAFEEDPFALESHDRHTRSLAPAAVARRARFTRYVRGAVGASVLVCAAALVKTALTRDDYEPPRRWAATQAPALSDRAYAAPEEAPPPVTTPSADRGAGPAATGESAVDAGDSGKPAARPAVGPAEDPGASRALRVR